MRDNRSFQLGQSASFSKNKFIQIIRGVMASCINSGQRVYNSLNTVKAENRGVCESYLYCIGKFITIAIHFHLWLLLWLMEAIRSIKFWEQYRRKTKESVGTGSWFV